jgi:hypothetical protein
MGEAILAFLTANATFIEGLAALVVAAGTIYVTCKKILSKVVKGQMQEPLEVINTQITTLTDTVDKLAKTVDIVQETNNDQMEKINLLLEHQNQLGITDKHILRALITGKYYEYKEKGYLPILERECITLLYEDYKALNGNTFIDGLYAELMALEDKDPTA